MGQARDCDDDHSRRGITALEKSGPVLPVSPLRRAPRVDPSAWLAPTSSVLGDVEIQAHASVWFGAVIRADNEPIVIGEGSNVQDNCVLHTDPDYPLLVSPDVTVGHNATIHGAIIGRGSLVGIGAILLNGCRIGEGSIIGAGALVGEGVVIPPGSLAIGTPARVVREVTREEHERVLHNAANYRAQVQQYGESLLPRRSHSDSHSVFDDLSRDAGDVVESNP